MKNLENNNPKIGYSASFLAKKSFIEKEKSRVYVPEISKNQGRLDFNEILYLGKEIEDMYPNLKFTPKYGEDEKGIFFFFEKPSQE